MDEASARRFQLEEDLREKRRKLEMVFLSYAKMAQEEQARLAATKAAEEKNGEIFSKALRVFLTTAYASNCVMLSALVRHGETVANYFTDPETPEEKVMRESLQKNLQLSNSEFAALALAGCAKAPDFSAQAKQLFLGAVLQSPKPPESFRLMGRSSAEQAMQAYRDGNPARLEKLIMEDLKCACYAFTHDEDPTTAMHWSRHINELLGVMSTHPALFKKQPDAELMKAAVGVAALGRIMESGYTALMELQNHALSGKVIDPAMEQEFTAKILLMQQADDRRRDDTFRVVFSEGYHPRRGVPADKMHAVLEQLKTSNTLRQLSEMPREHRIFALSDRSSRCSISTSLSRDPSFSLRPLMEVKKPSEKQVNPSQTQISSPQIHI